MLSLINENFKAAAIYARVSTSTQMEEGFSIPSQIKACKQKALDMGIQETNLYIYQDDVSGATLNRPALNQMRKDITKFHIDYIICYEPDRLSRKLAHLILLTEEFNKNNQKLFFVTEQYDNNPTSQMFFKLKGLIAEYEREKIKERSIRGKKEKMLQGKIPKHHLYGYSYCKEKMCYEINEQEANVVKQIFTYYLNDMSSTDIIKKLQADNVPKILHNKNVGWFSTNSIIRILKNDSYLGFFHGWKHNGPNTSTDKLKPKSDWINIPIPAIIDKKTFELVQQKISQNKLHSKRNEQHINLLANIGYCICGRRLCVRINSKKEYYSCASRFYRKKHDNNITKCNNPGIPIKKTDLIFWEALSKICKSEESIVTYINKYEKNLDIDKLKNQLCNIEKEIKKKRNEQNRILDWFSQDLLNEEQTQSKLKRISKDIEDLLHLKEQILSQMKVQTSPKKIFDIFIKERKVTLEEKRNLVRKIVDKVYINRIVTENLYNPKAKLKLNIFIMFKNI